MEVIKRDGRREAFDEKKVQRAITRALLSIGHDDSAAWAVKITAWALDVIGQYRSIQVEEIQDIVQEILQENINAETALAYVNYRFRHQALRNASGELDKPDDVRTVKNAQRYFPTEIQKLQFYDKYSRYDRSKGRRETWPETVRRVFHFLQENVGSSGTSGSLSNGEWEELRDAVLKLDVMPSMRLLQMAGPALEAHGHVGAYNCAYLPIDSLTSFVELLFILMQGTGVGYSVEWQNVAKLPTVQYQHPEDIDYLTEHTIEDSTEGWCNALRLGIETWFQGHAIIFDYSKIRPQGAALNTKGGRASGPRPLQDLLTFVRDTIADAQGRRLTPLECHEIACYCGYIVQVGGVRRSALICLFDDWDLSIAGCKQGEFWLAKPWLAMANNSAVYEGRPTVANFLHRWANLIDGQTGEPGIFNREQVWTSLEARSHKRVTLDESTGWAIAFGTNPCGEIILRPRQFCNLTIAVARPADTIFDLKRKIRLATILGTVQSTLTDFGYLDTLNQDWKKNCEEERLLGVDITGIQDNPVLRYRSSALCFPPQDDVRQVPLNQMYRRDALSMLRDYAVSMNQVYAKLFGIPESASVTCVKPSGNSSQLLDTSSGLHPRFAPYYIRRFRIGAYTPIAALLRESGIPFQPEVGQTLENATVLVFEFPVASPKDALTRRDMHAQAQLENWLDLKLYYTEHNPSTTVVVDDDEWIETAAWVHREWQHIGGLTFFPKDGNVYQLAPYEEISKERYEELSKNFPTVDYSKLVRYEHQDETTSGREFNCTSGACEL